MPICPECRQDVAPGHSFCMSCGARLSEAAPSTVVSGADTEVEESIKWTKFVCEDGAFTIERPAEWLIVDPPVSEGAALSCVGPDRFTLLEAFAYSRPPGLGIEQGDMATMLADGIGETVGKDAGHSRGRIVSRAAVTFRDADAAWRVRTSYDDRGLDTTTDYFTVSRDDEAVMLAMKVLGQQYERRRPLFEQFIESLSAWWL